jgi:xanthine/CO dehydrogenase XdhC/CoxF family maturation factor
MSGFAIATVIDSKRSAPRPRGPKMAVSESGEIYGGVAGGCVEEVLRLSRGRKRCVRSQPAARNGVAALRRASSAALVSRSAGWKTTSC